MRKDRARKAVLWHLCQFSLGVRFGDQPYVGTSCFRDTKTPAIGSLVALQSMRAHDFYLGWVHDVRVGANEYATVYTVESIETGQIIDWSNVGVREYSRDQVDAHPEWRWTDEQWEFNDRWNKVCYGKRDAYIVLPCQPKFDGNSVTMSTRIRFGMGDPPLPKTFAAWKKVRMNDMLDYFDASVAEFEARKAKPKESQDG